MYTRGRERERRCGYTSICIAISSILMILIATAVTIAVIYIMQPSAPDKDLKGIGILSILSYSETSFGCEIKLRVK